jgi:hypothetical protein
MIQFTCVCGKLLQAREEHAGQRTRCPRCHHELDIPDPNAAAHAVPARALEQRVTPARPAPPYEEPEEDEADDRPRRRKRRTSGKAIASLILGILGIVPCLILTGAPALVLAFLSLGDIRASRDRLRGRGLAITGLVLGCVSIVFSLVILPALLLVPAWQRAAGARERQKSANNLRQIGIALHNYHDVYGQFPPAVVYNGDGQPLYSWRVLILPFLEQENIYRQFKLDEPWDSPNNRNLSQLRILVYEDSGRSLPPGNTVYLGFNGKDTVFESDPRGGLEPLTNPGGRFRSKTRVRFADIADGTSNTILVAEATDPVPWAKPQDLDYADDRPLPKLGDPANKFFQVLMCDGSVRTLQYGISERTLRAAITKSDGQVLGGDW